MISPDQGPFKKRLGQEYIDAEEDKIIADMLQEMQSQMERLYKEIWVPRQIHTKMHGCVKAAFVVEPDLPEELRVGVFKEPRTYHAWVRFSNSSTRPQPDKKKDIRGIAIKLMGVKGEKLLNDQHLEESQDFLLMSSETFFSRNLKQFRHTLKSSTSPFMTRLLLYFLNPMHWGIFRRLLRSLIRCENPLNIPYWSTQPYQFGESDKAVKYFLKPSPYNTIVNENTTDDNYLRTNMAHTLIANEAEFDFCVQFQTNPDTMPIEDPTIAWKSPFHKVATLKIIPQVFTQRDQILFGENLSFNSWHSLPAHRPLGSFNRARKRVYEEMSKYRHERNNVPVFEPKDSPDFLLTGEKLELEPTSRDVPLKGVIRKKAEILVRCDQATAYRFISGSNELPLWLKKYKLIHGARNIEILKGPYDEVGARRKVFFDNGDSIVEELILCNEPYNYAYTVTDFSNAFRFLTKTAYGRLWFDVNGNKTRITWEYAFSYRNLFARLFIALFMALVYKKFMMQSLQNAKGVIEDMD